MAGKWKDASPASLHPPIRKTGDVGTLGRPIRLYTNHFEVKCTNKNCKLVHYDVVIRNRGSTEIPKRKKLAVFEKMKIQLPKIFEQYPLAFDLEKNAYSVGVIPQLKTEVTYIVTMNACDFEELKFTDDSSVTLKEGAPATGSKKKGKKKKESTALEDTSSNRNDYFITLKKVNEVTLGELFDSLKVNHKKKEIPTLQFQMIEVMFRHYRAKQFLQVGRNSFFKLEDQGFDIQGGKEGRTGFFASLRPAAWKDGSILLNIDRANAAFYKPQCVIEFIKENGRIYEEELHSTLRPPSLSSLKKELKSLKVRSTHSHIRRTYRIHGFSKNGADKETFELEKDGKKIKTTVKDYFFNTYKYRLKYPSLNCLNVGNDQKPRLLPMEVCDIEKGQKVLKKLSDFETQSFIRNTAVPPQQRLQDIKRYANINNFKNDPMLKALSFQISDMPLKTNGRVLPEPGLKMDREFKPRDGKWDIRDKKFNFAAELEEWIVLNYDHKTKPFMIEEFMKSLVRMGREKGMKIREPLLYYKGQIPSKDFKMYQNKYSKLKLICCVIPGGSMGTTLYREIKVAGDRETGIISQCIRDINIRKNAPPTISNILLKINAKMGGTNNIFLKDPVLRSFKERVIIMGADVNHPPSGGDKNMPSLAAVVGSYDFDATKYQTEVRAQDHRVEIIQDLTEITINLLKAYYRNTRQKPQRIIMYRDGVSESQFAEVLAKEMLKIRGACTKLQADYKPGITYMCVQKRHHTRLFCENERDGVGRTRNVPPGTVVDKDITHPHEIDFYLCSHEGIQGTSRPSHYHVLWDDNDISLNELQSLTYHLCHVYSRCSRSVSIPTPAYYAHLAAFRAKVHSGGLYDDDVSSDTSLQISMAEIVEKTRMAFNSKAISNQLYYV